MRRGLVGDASLNRYNPHIIDYSEMQLNSFAPSQCDIPLSDYRGLAQRTKGGAPPRGVRPG